MSSSPDPDFLRVGTAEREEAGTVLGEHFAQGRLTPQEYEQRVGSAFEAATKADLRPLFDDLPPPHPSFLLPPASPSPYAAPAGPVPPSYTPAHVPSGAVGHPAALSPKSKIIGGVLQILLPFGVGRFYTGHTGMAIAQLLVTLFTFGVGSIWPIVDGILLLVRGGRDGDGRPLRD
jgi:hypothetical protein